MNYRRWLGTGLLVVVLSTWWAWNNRDQPGTKVVHTSNTDYRLEDFEIVALDRSGHESASLRAPFLERRRDDQVSLITRPLFLLPDSHGAHWQLRADRGELSADAQALHLYENVAGDSPDDGRTPPTQLRTPALTVFPQQHQLRSEEIVAVSRAGLYQSGRGFEADLQSKSYTLHSQVTTRYEASTH